MHRIVLLVLSCALAVPSIAFAQVIQFDMPSILECRDLTTPEFAALHPEERLIETRLPISTLVLDRKQERVVEILYRIDSPHRSLQIVDHWPQTTLEAEYASNLAISEKLEASRSLGVSMNGSYQDWFKATGVGDVSRKSTRDVRFERPSPLALIAASGTIHRGHGVYFKLKPSNQSTLEGSKDFLLKMRVPWNWRGDLLRVRYRAEGLRRGVVPGAEAPLELADGQFTVVLVAEGDGHARAAADAFQDAERRLRTEAGRHREAIERSQLPTVAHRVGAMLDIVSRRLPEDWLTELQTPSTARRPPSFATALPKPVRQAVVDYWLARQSVLDLNAGLSTSDAIVQMALEE